MLFDGIFIPPSLPLPLQNEKKMTLTQQESKKTKQSDEEHTLELREWRSEIGKRKQVRGKSCDSHVIP